MDRLVVHDRSEPTNPSPGGGGLSASEGHAQGGRQDCRKASFVVGLFVGAQSLNRRCGVGRLVRMCGSLAGRGSTSCGISRTRDGSFYGSRVWRWLVT